MRDILPTGVEFTGATVWTNGNWNCAYTGTLRTVNCTNSIDRVASGTNLGATILIPFTVTATSGQTVQNNAHIDNPLEISRCISTGTLPTDATSNCTLDTRNSNPAFLTIG
jgi:hypothetical protein